ncbi:hypothetical protein B0T18DRAFT_404787 [Schizothecium vesticola]|uniref:Uncharacterized protein n=1 Tax=Schizothecium vesticola TaxID=314040 RepID=A0AA40KB39_9PEZI|nr:hypothetical protein B0T18DRAFT_404787 [Schizothecium vesticola]
MIDLFRRRARLKLRVDHPDTLTSMDNLAFTWKGQGRRVGALALMEDYTQVLQPAPKVGQTARQYAAGFC